MAIPIHGGGVRGPRGFVPIHVTKPTYDPYQAYQATGIAGYGKTFQELQQASMDRNMDFINLRAANDAKIKAAQNGLDLNSGIWKGMDDYALTGALGGLANSELGRQLQEALVRKYGSTDALNNMINQYWAGGGAGINKPGFNYDFWQKLGTLNALGKDTSQYLGAGQSQNIGTTWADFGMSDAERQALGNTPASLAAQGLSGVIGGLSKNPPGAGYQPPNTVPPPPQQGGNGGPLSGIWQSNTQHPQGWTPPNINAGGSFNVGGTGPVTNLQNTKMGNQPIINGVVNAGSNNNVINKAWQYNPNKPLNNMPQPKPMTPAFQPNKAVSGFTTPGWTPVNTVYNPLPGQGR